MTDLERRCEDLAGERRALLQKVLKRSGIETTTVQVRPRDPALVDLPLSRSQEAVWFMDHLAPESGGLNLPSAVRIRGSLDLPVLIRCLEELQRRHEILRTAFPALSGRPVQRVRAELPLDLRVFDRSEVPAERRLDEAIELASERTVQPFDLAVGPAWRATIVRLSDEDHLLALVYHHIVWDGWSIGVFTGELSLLYAAFERDAPSPLPPPKLHFGDFAIWERSWLDGELLSERLGWWSSRLAGLEDLKLPLDRPRPKVQTFPGATVTARFHKELVDELDELRCAEGATLFATLFAAFGALLGRMTDQRRFALGTPVANRVNGELGGMIGPLANILVLPVELGGDPTFRELLGRVQQLTRGAFARQDLPYETLVDRLCGDRDPNRNPLFQVMFALHADVVSDMELPGLDLEPVGVSAETTHFDVGLHLWHRPQGLEGYCVYNREIFDASSIERILRQLGELLRAALARPDAPTSSLALGPEPEVEAWERRPAVPLPVRAGERVCNIGGPTPWPSAIDEASEVLHCAPDQLDALPEGDFASIVVSGGPPVAPPPGLRAPAWYLYAPPEAEGIFGVARCRPGELSRLRTSGISIRDVRGRRLPVGIAGELHAGDRSTNDRGRWLADGSLEYLGTTPGIGWRRGERIDLSALADAIQRIPGVHAARVVQQTAHLVATVVPASPGLRRSDIERQFSEVMVRLVDRATLDRASLAALPVLDDDVIRRWERGLGDQSRAAILPVRREQERLHIDDLLPERWSVDARPRRSTEPIAEPVPKSEAPRAYAKGEALEIPPEAPKTLVEALRRHSEARHGLTLVEADGSRAHLSYGDLWTQALQVCGGLEASGVAAGDHVILMVGPLGEFFPTFWGCLLRGVIPAVVAKAPTYEQRNGVLDKLWSAWELLGRPPILCGDDLIEPLRGARLLYGELPLRPLPLSQLKANSPGQVHDPRPEDVIFLQLSSGSTGVPKCIQETHRGVVTHVHSVGRHNGYGPDDVGLSWLPLDHVMALLTAHLRDTYHGARQVQVAPEYLLADPLRWLDLIDEHRVTQTAAPNFMYKLVNEALASETSRRWDLSCLRFFLNGGEQCTLPVVSEFVERTAAFGVRPQAMQPAFGMAESCTGVAYSRSFTPERAGLRAAKSSIAGLLREAGPDEESVFFIDLGPPVPGIELRIADDRGEILPEGVIGRFQIRGDVITPGYLANDEANREAFVGEGWFDTGDLGFLRGGRLAITGRAKESIIVRGVNFFCFDIEEAVSGIEGVEPTFAAVCVVEAEGAEQLAVFYVPTKPRLDPALVRTVRERVARDFGLAPEVVLPLAKEVFPKTTSGKVQRDQLRQGVAEGRFDALRRQVDLALGNERTVPRWTFQRTWVRRDVEPGPAAGATVRGEGALARTLREALPAGEATVWVGTPSVAELLDLLAELGPRGGRLLVVLAQADPIELAAIRALLLSAPQEWPGLDERLVELDQEGPDAVAAIEAELNDRSHEPEVVWRGGERSVMRLTEAAPRQGEGWLRPGDAILVTGGLGGIGILLVRELLTRLRARILLIGRRDLDGDDRSGDGQLGRVASNVERRYALRALEALPGEVIYRAADVTDAARLGEVMAEAEARWGRLAGAIHLAGVFPARLLAEERAESVAEVVAPKLEGVRALHSLLGPEAFLVGFGSVYGVFGGSAGGAYGVACASLEAFMAWRRGQGARRSACLHWSHWDEVGLSRGFAFRERSIDRGYRMIDARRGMASLVAALAGEGRDLIVGLDPTRPNVRRLLSGPPELTERLVAYTTAPAVGRPPLRDRFGRPIAYEVVRTEALPFGPDGRLDLARLSELTPAAPGRDPVLPRTGLERTIAAIWKDVLRIDEVDIDRTFFELGGQSVLLVQVVSRIEAAVDRKLPVVELFRYPTVRQLAAHLTTSQRSEPRFQKATERATRQRQAQRRFKRPQTRR